MERETGTFALTVRSIEIIDPEGVVPPSSAAWFVGRDPVSTWTPAGAVGGRVLVGARESTSIRAVEDAIAALVSEISLLQWVAEGRGSW